MTDIYQLVERAPTLGEYRDLCVAVGWGAVINFDAAPVSLRHSLYHVVALHDGAIVGMGRIVGDGAIYFYLQDIAVRPEHQRRGLGTRIMDQLVAYLRAHAPEQAFIGLFAAADAMPLYARYGFAAHPALTGMFRVAPI